MDPRNQLLLPVIWLRVYPIHDVLAYLFDVSATTVGRAIARVRPVLEASGRDTLRLPAPGRKRRRTLDALVAATPEVAVVLDTFEQRVQRHKDPTIAHNPARGTKKQHTLKRQVAVDAETGQSVDGAERALGPAADITVLEAAQLLDRLPEGGGARGALADSGIEQRHPCGGRCLPRGLRRGKHRPPEAVCDNRAFAQRRIVVEHSSGRLRRYQASTQRDRNHRQHHTARVRAVAGLVNRQRPVAAA